MFATLLAALPTLLGLAGQIPGVIDDVKSIWSRATAVAAPTAAEQAQYDAALKAANDALQAS